VWPEGLVHYVEMHRGPLPEEFLPTVERNSWSVPIVQNLPVLADKGFSLTVWKTWHEAQTAGPGSREQ
jgi:hypothetical protein